MCNLFLCGGSVPVPPAETVVSALYAGILSILNKSFRLAFCKKQVGFRATPGNVTTRTWKTTIKSTLGDRAVLWFNDPQTAEQSANRCL
jgi:hypothetical protein